MLTILWEDVPESTAHRTLLERLSVAAFAVTKTPTSHEITVLLTGDRRLRELNREYRDKDAATDVLSFAQRDAVDAGCKPALGTEGCEYLGDIAISLDRVAAQAANYGHSEERELAYLFVHGFLHLLGFTHTEDADFQKMRMKEEEILTTASLPRGTI
jgi:probable rRNA maturation factor